MTKTLPTIGSDRAGGTVALRAAVLASGFALA